MTMAASQHRRPTATIALAIVLAIVLSCAPQVATDPIPQVYITTDGTKYHLAGCRYLADSKIAVSLADAAAYYEPCDVCKPPIPAIKE